MKIKISIQHAEFPGEIPLARLHRVTRLMALAIKFKDDLEKRRIRDQAELARLGRVTRARMSQIMDLTLLSPKIIEEILYFPRIKRGHEILTETAVRKIDKKGALFERPFNWLPAMDSNIGQVS